MYPWEYHLNHFNDDLMHSSLIKSFYFEYAKLLKSSNILP